MTDSKYSLIDSDKENNYGVKTKNNPDLRHSTETKDSVSHNKIPKKLFKTFLCALSLFIVGLISIGVAIYKFAKTDEIYTGIAFIFLGIITLIPGGYYLYQFVKAKRQKDIDKRREVLEDIPELN